MPKAASNVAGVPRRNGAQLMRSRHNEQRRIIIAAIIKMCTDRNHAGQDVERRLNVNESRLYGPWTKPRNVTSCAHSDSAILMPRNGPVNLGGLVEDNRSHGTRGVTQQGRCELPNCTIRIERFTERMHAKNTATHSPGGSGISKRAKVCHTPVGYQPGITFSAVTSKAQY